ncbi:Nitroreductase [Spirosomataceae bacterium TFI 002]|nr:Nitroreductase [Spirosomataceae bacterium TFI 002]
MHTQYLAHTVADPLSTSLKYRELLEKRRSIRFFSEKPVSKQIIENILMTASSAPSGANKQPWTFCAISSASLKAKIREAAEKEEYVNYNGRMSDAWLEDLKKFDTNWEKPFIDIAPWIVIIFKHSYELKENEEKATNYYVNESVGIAAGMLISAIHNCGLVTLTHTPSPMDFLSKLLERPKNEKPFLLLPIGYPAEDATVPELKKKDAEEVIVWFE